MSTAFNTVANNTALWLGLLFALFASIAFPFRVAETLPVRANTVIIAIWGAISRQTPTVNVAASSIESRIAKTVAIVTQTMPTAVVCAIQALLATLAGPFQVTQAFTTVTESIVRTIVFASWPENFYFQMTAITAVDTTVVEVAHALAINTVTVATAVIRAWNCAIAHTATPSFKTLALAQ